MQKNKLQLQIPMVKLQVIQMYILEVEDRQILITTIKFLHFSLNHNQNPSQFSQNQQYLLKYQINLYSLKIKMHNKNYNNNYKTLLLNFRKVRMVSQ
jgi:hypothetical protein